MGLPSYSCIGRIFSCSARALRHRISSLFPSPACARKSPRSSSPQVVSLASIVRKHRRHHTRIAPTAQKYFMSFLSGHAHCLHGTFRRCIASGNRQGSVNVQKNQLSVHSLSFLSQNLCSSQRKLPPSILTYAASPVFPLIRSVYSFSSRSWTFCGLSEKLNSASSCSSR